MLYCIYAVSCLQIIIDNSSLYVNRCFHYQHSCWYYIYFDNKCLLVEKGKPIPSPILAILVCKIRHSLAGGRGRVGVQDCFRELHRAGSHIPTKTGPMWVYYTGRCIHNFSTRTASLVRQGFCLQTVGQPHRINCVSYACDGHHIALAFRTKEVVIWRVDPYLEERVCLKTCYPQSWL